MDYGCEAIRKGEAGKIDLVEEFVDNILLSRSRKPGSSDLTHEEMDMGLFPDKYLSRAPYHNVLV